MRNEDLWGVPAVEPKLLLGEFGVGVGLVSRASQERVQIKMRVGLPHHTEPHPKTCGTGPLLLCGPY